MTPRLERTTTLSAPVAAFFDVDGTLTRTTILNPLIWYQRARLSRPRYAVWFAGLVLDVPRLVWIDRRSRSRLNAGPPPVVRCCAPSSSRVLVPGADTPRPAPS